jgi:hypothetical protein
VHKSGFITARLIETLDDIGKCRLQLDTGQMYEACEDDVESVSAM